MDRTSKENSTIGDKVNVMKYIGRCKPFPSYLRTTFEEMSFKVVEIPTLDIGPGNITFRRGDVWGYVAMKGVGTIVEYLEMGVVVDNPPTEEQKRFIAEELATKLGEFQPQEPKDLSYII